MNYLNDHEIECLIGEIKSGNNDAWERIYHNFENYIHKCCQAKLKNFYMSDAKRKDLEDDLYMAGWEGFVESLKKYDSEKAKLLTYATYNINGKILEELDFQLNTLGLTERPKPVKKRESDETEKAVISRISIDDEARISENVLS